MQEIFKYINHVGETITFNSDGVVANTKELKAHKWEYTAQYKRLKQFGRNITAVKFPVVIYGYNAKEKANKIHEIIDKDILAVKSGRLYFGDYFMQGYFNAVNVTRQANDATAICLELTYITDAPYWIAERSFIYRTWDDTEVGGQGYPYDYPYAYLSGANSRELINPSFADSDFKLTVYGAVTNPIITIGGNKYGVNAVIARNEYLVIDTSTKEIYKITGRGVKVNLFAERKRDLGYSFAPIKAGNNLVLMSPECNIDITLYEKRSAPKWT